MVFIIILISIFLTGRCVLENSMYTIQYTCPCGGTACKSTYPCLLIYATLNRTMSLDSELLPSVPMFKTDQQLINAVLDREEDNIDRVRLNIPQKKKCCKKI